MTEALLLGLALIVGCVLGAIYFGGLWLTVRELPTARRPALLMLASLLGRLAITLVGFYLVSGGRWERLLLALLGFVCVRRVFTGRLRPREDAVQSPAKGDTGA